MALQVDVAGRGDDGTAASRSGGMQNGPSGGHGALGGFGGSDGGVAADREMPEAPTAARRSTAETALAAGARRTCGRAPAAAPP
jgi:hypothetical protein